MEERELLERAKEALINAYAPYSGYRVGAALLTREGKVFCGVNVENASFGLTICAERAAVAAAIASGYRSFVALAVAAEGEKEPFPCGACRQVLKEFGEMKVIIAGKKGKTLSFKLEDLLPYPFVKGENQTI